MKLNHSVLIQEIINANTDDAAQLLAAVLFSEINVLEHNIRILLEEQQDNQKAIERLERNITSYQNQQKIANMRLRLQGAE
ncbi:hypothetical protein HNP12_000196 [Aeromonas hydrophila]|uniref:hypothetical protein n=1 Tax=Aeromonas hydrophila TaxID=644 RepID=UPI00216876AB|nr:hypothetical protein [Aeromonas hydrophila]MCS3766157.1 hypothetical protein [Aeromonas hydrophila]